MLLRFTSGKAVVVVFVLLSALTGKGFPEAGPWLTHQRGNTAPQRSIFANIVHAREVADNPGNVSINEGSCWSETDLQGTTGDKLIVAAPHHTRNIPPARTVPTLINQPLPSRLANSIRSVNLPEGKSLIALTFDLCEVEKEISGYDAEIVNYLRTNKVKATFFAGGKWMRSHPEKTMQLMSDPLFEVGNHAWNHKNLRLLDNKTAEEQILWSQAQYELLWEELNKKQCSHPASRGSKSIPQVPLVFRFPFGTCNPESLKMLQELGIYAIQWDTVSGDAAKGQTAQAITGIVLKSVKPGSIIIFHANGRGHGTAESLKVIVPKLRARGFEFTTVSELLAAGTPEASSECYENRPGDNARYDKIRTE
jgi:peptidoglycan-N-acetylglucosamine deacetylase